MALGKIMSWVLGSTTSPGPGVQVQPMKPVVTKTAYGMGLVSLPVVPVNPYSTAVMANAAPGYQMGTDSLVPAGYVPAPVYGAAPETANDYSAGIGGC